MTVGKIIESTDYNLIRNKIIAVLSTGGTNPTTGLSDPTFGYGQAPQSSAVAIGDKVTKAQWDNLRWDIYNCHYHQTATAPSIQIVTTNTKIQSTILNYETFADTTISNRTTVNSANLAPEGGTSSTGATTSRNFSWTSLVTCVVTVNFANANNARYFFNTGGRIRFASSFVKSINNPQNVAWENLLSTVGTQSFGGTTAFYSLTNSYTTWYTSPPLSTPYGGLSYQLDVRSNVASNSNGTATQLTFQARWIDNYTNPGDLIQGTLSLTASQLRAITPTQPSGTPFTISGPASYSISTIA